jgi:hypothetical protein
MRTPNTPTTIAATQSSPDLEAVAAQCDGMPAVVAPPHPLYGGSIDIPAVGALYDALANAGFSPLAFNWRGVGNSRGATSGEIDDAVGDYLAAVQHASSGAPLLAAGYSWGAAAALVVAAIAPQIERLVLIAPPIAMMEDKSVLDTGRPLHVIAGSDDTFAPRDVLEAAIGPIENATLDIIEGGDHFFSTGGLDRIEAIVGERLARNPAS